MSPCPHPPIPTSPCRGQTSNAQNAITPPLPPPFTPWRASFPQHTPIPWSFKCSLYQQKSRYMARPSCCCSCSVQKICTTSRLEPLITKRPDLLLLSSSGLVCSTLLCSPSLHFFLYQLPPGPKATILALCASRLRQGRDLLRLIPRNRHFRFRPILVSLVAHPTIPPSDVFKLFGQTVASQVQI